jgi:hypothetical protein
VTLWARLHKAWQAFWAAEEVVFPLDIQLVTENLLPDAMKHRIGHESVATEFVTEDDMNDFDVQQEKARLFLDDYGVDPNKVVVLMDITDDPQTAWGRGFPHQVKIRLLPRNWFYQMVELVGSPRVA